MIHEIIQKLPSSACENGVELLLKSAETDLCNLFFKHIDFCLAKNYPDIETIKQVPGHIDAGIIVSRKLVRENPERLAILGKSDVEVNLSSYTVSRIYVKHDSVLYLNATDNSYVVVDAQDNAQVYCKVKGNARVVVNQYKGASSIGATKTIIKKRITYDL